MVPHPGPTGSFFACMLVSIVPHAQGCGRLRWHEGDTSLDGRSQPQPALTVATCAAWSSCHSVQSSRLRALSGLWCAWRRFLRHLCLLEVSRFCLFLHCLHRGHLRQLGLHLLVSTRYQLK